MRALVLSVLTLALLAPGVLRADEPRTYDEMQRDLEGLRRRQVPLVQRLLEARDGRQIARGATWARELSLQEVIPDLVSVLERGASGPDPVPHVALLAVFDALVELGATVDASVLVPYVEQEHPAPGLVTAATILALRSGASQTQLAVFDALDARAAPSLHEAWLALGNVLARPHGPAGFDARLIARLEVALDVLVVDHEERRSMTRGIGGSCGGWRGAPPAGYPPVRRYALGRKAVAGATLLADGPIPIYVRRVEAEPWADPSFVLRDRNRDRLAWIAARLRVDPDELPLQAVETAYLRWTGAADLAPALAVEREKVRDAWGVLLEQLLERGWIRPAEAARLEPTIRVVLRDDREDRSEPLPDVQPE